MTFVVQNISGRAQTEPKTLINVALTETQNNWPIGSIDFVSDEVINVYRNNPATFAILSGPIIGAPGIITGTITALAGGAKAGATALVGVFNRVSTVASVGDSVLLPASVAGSYCYIINDAANAINVYGAGTDTVNGVATGTGVRQMGKSVVMYECSVTGAWNTQGLGVGFNGSWQTMNYVNGLAANAGGVQAAATPIINQITRFTTVAGAGYSSLLPASAPGLSFTVINDGANAMNVFPTGADTINGGAASAAFVQSIGSVATYYCSVAGVWNALYFDPGMVQFAYIAKIDTVGAVISAAEATGATVTKVINMTGTLGAGANLQLPTVASMVALIPNFKADYSYVIRVINSGAGAFAWTVVTNTGWTTLTGTMTVAQNTWRDFIVAFQSGTAATLQSIGTGTNS